MKQSKAIWVFAALTALVVAYAVFDFRQENTKIEQEEIDSKIVEFEKDQIQKITLLTPSQEIWLERGKEGWRLIKPLEELANEGEIDGFLREMTMERASASIPIETEADLKKYGLDVPKGKIEIVNNLQKSLTLEVGTEKNFQGESYIRISGENVVRTSSLNWFRRLEQPVLEFRDRRIMREPVGQLQELEIQRKPKGGLAFYRKDSRWVIRGSENKILDQNRVRELFARLNNSMLVDFIQKPQKTPPVAFRMQAKLNLDRKWELTAYEGDNEVLLANAGSLWFKLDKLDAKSFLDLKAEELRDKSFPFAYKKDELFTLSIRQGEKNLKVNYKQGSWRSESGEVDDGQIKIFLNRFRDLEVAQFLGDRKWRESPEVEIELRDEKGVVILKVDIAAKEKMQFDYQYVARSSASGELFTLSEVKFANLELDKLFVSKPSSDTNTKASER